MINKDWKYCETCQVARRINKSPVSKEEIYTKELGEQQKVTEETRYIFKQITKLIYTGFTLDVGCGTGDLISLLSKGYFPTGLDSSDELLRIARNRNKHNRAQFLYGNANLYLLINNHFTSITACHIIEHLPNPKEFLQNSYKILIDNGYLIIATPNLLYSKDNNVKGTLWDAADHVYCFTPESLKRMVESIGYKIVKLETKTFNPLILRSLGTNTYHATIEKNENKMAPSIARNLFNFATDNIITNSLMWIPNRLSERNNKGATIILVAQKNET